MERGSSGLIECRIYACLPSYCYGRASLTTSSNFRLYGANSSTKLTLSLLWHLFSFFAFAAKIVGQNDGIFLISRQSLRRRQKYKWLEATVNWKRFGRRTTMWGKWVSLVFIWRTIATILLCCSNKFCFHSQVCEYDGSHWVPGYQVHAFQNRCSWTTLLFLLNSENPSSCFSFRLPLSIVRIHLCVGRRYFETWRFVSCIYSVAQFVSPFSLALFINTNNCSYYFSALSLLVDCFHHSSPVGGKSVQFSKFWSSAIIQYFG